MGTEQIRPFAPALWWHGLEQHYDTVLKGTVPTRKILGLLAHWIADQSGARCIADLGCGSGFFTKSLAKKFPQANFLALDADPRMIGHARSKNGPPNLTFQTCLLPALLLPKPDLVVSTFFFHQLADQTKQEVLKSLKNQGVSTGLVLDFDQSHQLLPRALMKTIVKLPKFSSAKSMVSGQFRQLATAAGWHCRPLHQLPSLFGKISAWELSARG